MNVSTSLQYLSSSTSQWLKLARLAHSILELYEVNYGYWASEASTVGRCIMCRNGGTMPRSLKGCLNTQECDIVLAGAKIDVTPSSGISDRCCNVMFWRDLADVVVDFLHKIQDAGTVWPLPYRYLDVLGLRGRTSKTKWVS
ncbi:hypothetical protein CY34DRAFT_798021, partial [Suillus luteus UH-Slu-Lm8-n1]